MNWLAIIRLLVILWPVIEKIIGAVPDDKKATAKAEAIAAIVKVVTEDNIA